MPERITRPGTADNILWNTTPFNPSNDPGPALRAAGWALNDVPGSDEFNYLQTMWGDHAQWIEFFAAREWSEIGEGVAAAGYKDLFKVTPPATGTSMSPRLSQIFSIVSTAATGGNPFSLCGDGEQLYYIAGGVGQSVIAANPANLGEIWEVTATVTSPQALEADGLYVYASGGIAGEPGLRRINRATGAAAGNGGVEWFHQLLRSNGVYCIGIDVNSSAGKVVFYTVATPTETGTQTPTTQLYGAAIDYDQCYVGGVRNTQDIWAYTLSSRALAWSTTLPTTTAPQIEALCADGDFVYAVSDRVALTAGGNANTYCLDRVTGAVLWTLDVAAADLVLCEVDDRYLYVVDSTNDLYAIRLRAAVPGVVGLQTNVVDSLYVDGVSIYCRDGATATNVRRLAVGGPTKVYMVASGDDPSRRPFYNLSVPLGMI